MRSPWFLAVLLFTVATVATADPLKLSGSIRARMEDWSFFDAPGYDDEYVFFGATLRASLAQRVNPNFDWQVELAAPALVNLPEGAVAPAPLGQLGLGGSYYAANGGDTGALTLFPKQAFVRWKSGAHSIRAGRFEFAEGNEVTPKNAMLAAVKNARVAQRLIGPFGFSHVGRSADGAQYVYDTGSLNVTAAAFTPTVGAFDAEGLGEVDDVGVAYGALTYSRPNVDERLFVILYDDTRGLVKTDNRPAAVRNADRSDLRIMTAGGHYLAAFGNADLLLWTALQAGEWGTLDHAAAALDVEAGYHFAGPRKATIRGGIFRASGDSDPSDDEHGTFFQVLPTPRVYARFPFYNAMNSTDFFAQFSIKPSAKWTLTSELHALALSEDTDLWYAGGGAFQDGSFGFAGRPASGSEDLARVLDLSVDYAINPKTSLTLYVAAANGGDVVDRIFAGKDARYVYFEVMRRF